jgi:hypothetical protein
MATASSVAQTAYIFKIYYAGQVGDVAMRSHPTLDRMPKSSKAAGHAGSFKGTTFNYSIKYGNSQGVSGTFATAQSNASTTKGVQFAASRFVKYGNIVIDGVSLLASQDDGAFLDLVTLETDGVIAEHIDREAFDLFRTSTGIRGRRASASSNIITMTVADDARNFKIGMTVGASPNADGSSPRTGTTTVAGVSLIAGTVTLTSAAAISSFADNDYMFNAGDIDTCMEGMGSCTPLTAPGTSDSFRGGVNRSVYTELLSGSRLASAVSSNQTIEENFGQLGVFISTTGGKANEGVLNPINFWQVVRRGNARVEFQSAGGNMTYGFETATISTPAGTIKLFSDPDCPLSEGRLWNMDSHYLRCLGPGGNSDFVHIINDDGNYNLRATNADQVETRTRSIKNYIQNSTRDHGVFGI